jgi:hypothetical protein
MLISSAVLNSQSLVNPAYGLVSHETMTVKVVEFTEDNIKVVLEVENRAADGYFCVDRNTYLIMPDCNRTGMIRLEGLPYCPDLYRFKRIGEKLSFSLIFSRPAGNLPAWFDIVEECSDNCFSVYGITPDREISTEIERAYEMAESGMPAEAGTLFRKILAGLKEENHGISGSLYSNIIIMYLREGDENSAREWFTRLQGSKVPGVELYVANLAARGIRW